ncbi:MAG: hypothetical protein WED10_07610 [Brumimicrobium sp.]
MKKLIILILGLGVVIALVFIASDLSKNSKTSDLSLIDFAVQDTAKVDKISIYDSHLDQSFTVIRNKNGKWKDKDGNCVQQEIVEMMLKTMQNITLKGYVPSSSMDNMKKLMMSKNKEVKIYQDGEWVKTWYVGHSTQDHMGTHMLLETPDKKSNNPVIMGMKGFSGILDPRFFTDPRQFACTQLFSFKRKDLKKVEVTNYVSPQESFKITKRGAEYDVNSNYAPLENVNKTNLLFYLNGFENINYNQANYTLSEDDIDSLTSKTPDYKVKLQTIKNEHYELDLYRRLDPESSSDTTMYDRDYLWAKTPNGEVVRMQYYVIGPIINGQTIFVDNSVNN